MAKQLMASLDVSSGPKGPVDAEGMEADAEASDHEVMAQELMDAFKAGDAATVAEVLKSFIKTCSYEHDDEGME